MTVGGYTNHVLAGVLYVGAAMLLVAAYVPPFKYLNVCSPFRRQAHAGCLKWDIRAVGSDVFLAITNQCKTRQFWASVESIEGTVDPYSRPFTLRWQEQVGERRKIVRGETKLLYLVHVEPEGNADEYPIEHGTTTRNSVERRVRHWKPGRFRFMGVLQKYVVYLDLSNLQPLTKTLRLERYQRRLRVQVRVRSADEFVNEARTVVLGILEVGQSRHTWGLGDGVFAEIEPTA